MAEDAVSGGMTFVFADAHLLEVSEPRLGSWREPGGCELMIEADGLRLTPVSGSIVSMRRDTLSALQLSRDGNVLCDGKTWRGSLGNTQHVPYFRELTSRLIKSLDVGSPIIVLLDAEVSMVYVDLWMD